MEWDILDDVFMLMGFHVNLYQYVPHKAVAEVSKIGNI